MDIKAQGARHKAQSTAQRALRWRLPCALSLVLCALSLAAPTVHAQYGNQPKAGTPADEMPAQLKEVTFDQKLNAQLPVDAMFKDETGASVALGDYFTGQKPVVFAFVYYQCPMLCEQVMNGISSTLKAVPFTPGKDFDVVLVSFDPRDTPPAAAEKKQKHLAYWHAQGTAGAWHFLTGSEDSIRRVTRAAGFNYRWDQLTNQFAHVSGVLVVTPDGRLSQYFYGVEYSPKDLRLALVEAGEGKIGSVIDQVLLFCYHYDPAAGRYGVMVINLVRAGGVLTVACMVGFILVMRRREVQIGRA